MNDDRNLDRLLADHLSETARPMPEHIVDGVLELLPRQRQERRTSIWLGRANRGLLAIGAAAVVIAALVIGPTIFANLALGPAGRPTPTPHLGDWHRNNYGASHETLACVEGAQAWTCTYGDAAKNGPLGHFSGRNITDSWSCLDWFAPEICDPANLVAVYEGNFTVVPSDGATEPPAIGEDYVVTNINGQEILYLYWRESDLGTFYCPWFRTFQEALDAPFECTVRP